VRFILSETTERELTVDEDGLTSWGAHYDELRELAAMPDYPEKASDLVGAILETDGALHMDSTFHVTVYNDKGELIYEGKS